MMRYKQNIPKMTNTKEQTQQAIAKLLEKLNHSCPVKDDGFRENDYGEGEDCLIIEGLGLEIWLYDLIEEAELVGIVTRKHLVEITRYTLFPVVYDAGDRDTPESYDVGIPTVVYGLPKCLEAIAERVSSMAIQWIMESLDDEQV